MRGNSWIFAVLLGIAGSAEARQLAERSRIELAASAAVIEAKPDEISVPYYQSWYATGRYAGSIAYYWTRNLKTEYEYSWSHPGSRQMLDYVRIGGTSYPYYFEEFHQLQQHSLRMVYQFGHNQWVHPYLSAGAVMDMEHLRSHVPVTYQPRAGGGTVLVHNESDSDRGYHRRGGLSVGGGAKFYMSPRSFFNLGASGTISKPARTISLIAGFGVEF